MPLDDIFYKEEKPVVIDGQRLRRRWKTVAIIIGLLSIASISTTHFLSYSYRHNPSELFVSAFLVYLVLFSFMTMWLMIPISQLLKFIPYKGLSLEERADIYFYIGANVLYIFVLIFSLYSIFIDFTVYKNLL